MAELALELHVVFDLIERHVAGPFDHHLHALGPGALGQFAERCQLAKLGFVGGVGQAAGAQAVAEAEADVVLAHDVADVVEDLVHRVLLVVGEHPLGQQRCRRGETMPIRRLRTKRQMLAQHAGVDREVVDALLRLLFQLLRGSRRS